MNVGKGIFAIMCPGGTEDSKFLFVFTSPIEIDRCASSRGKQLCLKSSASCDVRSDEAGFYTKKKIERRRSRADRMLPEEGDE